VNPGFAFRAKSGEVSVGVIYTDHFVERYEQDIPTRPAAKKTINETKVRELILKAIPRIVEWFQGGYTPDALIRARSSKVNMSLTIRKKGGGITIIMKNIMVKEGYDPSSFKDYVIELNPPHTVHFLRKMDRDLKVAVADHLAGVVSELEPDATYELTSPEASFTVDLDESDIYVEDADWLEDMAILDV
jgi:hypothetical protein